MSENELGPSANESVTNAADGRMSRRRLLAASGAVGAAAAVGLGAAGTQPAAADSKHKQKPKPPRRTGTIADLKHIVIVMQENRSFDHYFGTLKLPGVRGFGDKQVLTWQNGRTNFFEPNSRPEGFLLPYRADTTKYNAQNTSARAFYFEQEDIPWHHALANAYTVADHYFCALNTSTDPNRIMFWTGTNDPDGTLGGGPRINNNQNGQFLFKWKTYPEVLQDAGITWQMYVDNNKDTGWLGDFEDNLLRDFARFNPATASDADKAPGGLLARGNIVVPYTTKPDDVANDFTSLDYVLRDFISDCAAGTLPQVSWLTSPAAWSEHPNNAPNHGAAYCDRVLQAVHENPELWESTLIIINFDETNGADRIGDGGFFDHVTPPIPEAGTKGERAPGLWPGTGGRIPLTMVSPWTRGGWVVSEVFDHTSTIKLIEQWTKSMGKPAICENISDWRRSVSGDMLAAIDFTQFDTSFPTLPTRNALHAVVVNDATLPPVPQPAVGAQVMPEQHTTGKLKVRPLSFQPNGVLVENRAAGTVRAELTLSGGPKGKAVSVVGLADKFVPSLEGSEPLGLGQDALPITVSNQKSSSYTWDTTQTDGSYALSFYGPDRFVRSFAGSVVPANDQHTAVPSVDVELTKGKENSGRVELVLSAAGQPVTFVLTANDFAAGHRQTVRVKPGKSHVVKWPVLEGYYDVIVTTEEVEDWKQRYAGRVAQA
jgi:phospholipase C